MTYGTRREHARVRARGAGRRAHEQSNYLWAIHIWVRFAGVHSDPRHIDAVVPLHEVRELCRDRLPSVAAQLLRAPSRPGQRGARPGRGGEAAATRRLGSETTQALRGAQLAQEEAQEAPAYPSQVFCRLAGSDTMSYVVVIAPSAASSRGRPSQGRQLCHWRI